MRFVALCCLVLLHVSSGSLQLQAQRLMFTADIDPSTTTLTLSHSCGQIDNKCRMLVVPAGAQLGGAFDSAHVGDLVDVYANSECNPHDFFIVATETKGQKHGAAYR